MPQKPRQSAGSDADPTTTVGVIAPQPDALNVPPFETEDLRKNLEAYFDVLIDDPVNGPEKGKLKSKMKIGNYKWGVYAFFDYDGEPIYVGQTNEKLRTRIGRHLTNQRTDAVAMSVLDPLEVYEIKIWPLPYLQKTSGKDKSAKASLDALERLITKQEIAKSKFKAILNEKDPPTGGTWGDAIPGSFRGKVISNRVFELRSHPDVRLARRALIIGRLAQVISERKVQGGLRRVLVTQAKRLQWLSERRFEALGGASSVEVKKTKKDDGED